MTRYTQKPLIAVIGAGTMGAGIAQVAAQAGHPVQLYDQSSEACQQALQGIRHNLTRLVEKGKLSVQEAEQITARLQPAARLDDLADAQWVIEAIVENLGVKQQLFQQLEQICSPQCSFASNTSSISITAIAGALQYPNRLVGMHFFNPAPMMKLVEVVAGLDSDASVLAQCQQLAQAWGKFPVLCRSTPGFIVNRVARPYYAEAWRALEEQVTDAATLDAILVQCGGFRMGPIALTDLIGQDVNYAVTQTLYELTYFDSRYRPAHLQRELVDAGRLGRKKGHGWYRYDAALPSAQPHPAVASPSAGQSKVEWSGDWQALKGFHTWLSQQGITHQAPNTPAHLVIDGVLVALTQGETASAVAARHQQPTVLFDLCGDYLNAEAITLCAAAQNRTTETESVIAFFQSLGKQVYLISDYPGMLVFRTVAMLCNEALELELRALSSREEIDFALCQGVNYPCGPIAWGEQLGWQTVLTLLDALHQHYGESRYRASSLLRQRALLASEPTHYPLNQQGKRS